MLRILNPDTKGDDVLGGKRLMKGKTNKKTTCEPNELSNRTEGTPTRGAQQNQGKKEAPVQGRSPGKNITFSGSKGEGNREIGNKVKRKRQEVLQTISHTYWKE